MCRRWPYDVCVVPLMSLFVLLSTNPQYLALYTISDTSDASAKTLERISLIFQAPWPLQLIFTDEVMAKYQVIFRFLLKIRHVQTRLGHMWATQVCGEGREEG